MDIIKSFNSIRDYVHGFLEVTTLQTPRYDFIVQSFDLVYQNTSIKTEVKYIPVGCYRPFKNFTSDLNDKIVCRKFKPDHARMIIGIDTLEKMLDFKSSEQTKIYIDFVSACIKQLKGSHV